MTAHTLAINDELSINETLKRGGNNMKTSITDSKNYKKEGGVK